MTEIKIRDITCRVTPQGPGIAEVLSDETAVTTAEAGGELLADLYYNGYDAVILHERNIAPAFFDLRSGMAGEILQQASNFRMRLAVVGDFSKYESRSLHGFISESNRKGQILFVDSATEAAARLSKS